MNDPKELEKTALAITRAVGSPASIIIHTILFAASFVAAFTGYVTFDRMLLVLTTVVSLEAIYLAIFIQMTINYQQEDIAEVQEDIDEIQEDVEEISEDIDELQEDVEEISEDVEEIADEEETEEAAEERRKTEQKQTLDDIQGNLRRLIEDVERLKHNHASDNTKPML
jgi:low affinity Fe/Cu permease